jgi:hypothetical protein
MSHRFSLSHSMTAVIGALVAAAVLAAPAALAQGQKVLKFIPQADLRILDPITTTAYITRNHGYMIYDTLFATDAKFQVQPQMVDKYELSKDQLTYTFTLRDGLKFHDGAPVRSADCIASIDRWSKRDALGQKLAEATESWKAVNDKTFTLKLKHPFPLTLEALAKPSSNVPFIMPERIAKTDASTNITEAIGSGPFKFVKEEWVPGSKVVYVKNTDYVPRKEPPSWAAGGKVVKVDRVEWIYIPDSATAAAAINAGEVDWWEQMPPDLIPVLAKNKSIKVENIDPLGSMGMIRFNFMYPPFNNEKMRQEERASVLFVFHLRHAARERSRRGADERQARFRQGEGTHQGIRLQGRKGRHHRRDRSADRALAVAAHRRDAAQARSERRRAGGRLGHADHAPDLEGTRGQGRLVDFPHLAGRSRPHLARGELRGARQRPERLVRLGRRPEDRGAARGVVQRHRPCRLEEGGRSGAGARLRVRPVHSDGAVHSADGVPHEPLRRDHCADDAHVERREEIATVPRSACRCEFIRMAG